ncbi:GNAT family N-acetyltransferase [Bailinhaonella thermotolerans]|uniref:GNAT family N-acetyltransferase n=1 Tax=Bailinhaonella thermotolerans TaxID=1070861 RepID=A0A3A4B1X8_9ACTN|nr:GNAT family N-acetyltransferase [Bailinhaonella thermotolerans]RJL32017.1 GNAT family N-acetyltransferase [Bailinhaonella thermotolerans]
MTRGIKIRIARAGEIEDVLEFWAFAAEGKSISDDLPGVRRLIDRDPDALLVADLDGEIVGTVIAGWDGWRCHLYRLAVHPAHRRRGIARMLLEEAERRFVEYGGRRGDAMVLDDNALAHHAWRAAGYARESHWSRWTKRLAAATMAE